MCSGLRLHGRAPLPTDMTPRANKHLKLQIRKLDAIASWHRRKWPIHAQIRGFAKVNTRSNREGDMLKMPPEEHTPTVPQWGQILDICSWLEYIAMPAVGCTAAPLWSAIAVKCSIFKLTCAVVRLLCWPVGLRELFITLQGLSLCFSSSTEKQRYRAAFSQLELHRSECIFFQGGYGQ